MGRLYNAPAGDLSDRVPVMIDESGRNCGELLDVITVVFDDDTDDGLATVHGLIRTAHGLAVAVVSPPQ